MEVGPGARARGRACDLELWRVEIEHLRGVWAKKLRAERGPRSSNRAAGPPQAKL